MVRCESRPGTIGPITLGTKQTGAPSAGNPHAGCDVAGAGNGFTVWLLRHSQRKRGATARPDLRKTAPVLDPTPPNCSLRWANHDQNDYSVRRPQALSVDFPTQPHRRSWILRSSRDTTGTTCRHRSTWRNRLSNRSGPRPRQSNGLRCDRQRNDVGSRVPALFCLLAKQIAI